MNELVSSELKEIEKLAKAENYHEAIQRTDALAERYPGYPGVWSTRGYVNCRQGNLPAAIEDMSRCIKLRGNEPDDFFTRGRFLFRDGRYEEAVADFTRVIQLCDRYKSDYYRQAAYCFRADAYVRLRQFDKAEADCGQITNKGTIWTDKMRTKDELLGECRRRTNEMKRGQNE